MNEKITSPAIETPNTMEFTLAGKRGVATVYTKADKSRHLTINWTKKGVTALHTPVSHIDLRSMKAESLEEALKKVVNKTGMLALFTVTETKGKRGMIRAFRNEKNGNGYATLIRKGSKPFSFSLNRVDLAAMKAESLEEAFTKAVWATGSVAVVKYDTPIATPAAA